MIKQEFKELGFESFQQYNFPSIVNVCVIRGTCLCQCVHCPVGITPPIERHTRFGKSAISLRLFKKLIQEMTAFRHSTLRIHGVGEPILWKELSKALRFASEHNVRTWLFTCLITEDTSLLEELVEYCDIIEISVNSFDEDDYRKTKGIDAFLLVKYNIEFLRDIIISENLSTRIIVSRVESEDKQYDSDFVRYWKSSNLVSDAFIRSYHDYNALLDNRFQRKIQEVIPCLVHWSRFNIDYDGTVVLCFNELFKGKYPDESLVLGNMENQTISEIWHCEKLNLVRRAQLEKDYSIVKFTNKLPCLNCSSCQPLRQEGRHTSEYQLKSLRRWVNHG